MTPHTHTQTHPLFDKVTFRGTSHPQCLHCFLFSRSKCALVLGLGREGREVWLVVICGGAGESMFRSFLLFIPSNCHVSCGNHIFTCTHRGNSPHTPPQRPSLTGKKLHFCSPPPPSIGWFFKIYVCSLRFVRYEICYRLHIFQSEHAVMPNTIRGIYSIESFHPFLGRKKCISHEFHLYFKCLLM